MEDEFQGSEIKETAVKKTIQPVPFQARWETVQERNQMGKVELTSEQSTPRTRAQEDQEQLQRNGEQEFSLGLETVTNAVDSYMEASSCQSSSRYKLPAVFISKYKTGGD